MLLLTKEIKNKLPKLYANEKKKPEEIKVIVKFFNPTGAGTWYITEFDGEDTMFGYVTGLGFDELGYVSFKELSNIKCRLGLSIERDKFWNDKITLAEVMKKGG